MLHGVPCLLAQFSANRMDCTGMHGLNSCDMKMLNNRRRICHILHPNSAKMCLGQADLAIGPSVPACCIRSAGLLCLDAFVEQNSLLSSPQKGQTRRCQKRFVSTTRASNTSSWCTCPHQGCSFFRLVD